MAWEHQKSGTTIFLDILRNLLILAAACYLVVLIWKWNWIVALIAAIPVYVIMLNLVGFLTLPLYSFTPENRLKAKGFKALHRGDLKQMEAVTKEFIEKFNVNVPEESPTEDQMATECVDMVKIGLSMYLLPECEANFEKGYATSLTAAVVNAVFSESPSNETGRVFIEDEENRRNVALVIERAIKPQEKLLRLITEAVSVKCMQSYGMNPNPPETDFHRSCREPLENLKRLGLLIPGDDMPDLSMFIHNAGTFVAACKADLDLHKGHTLKPES